jgi:protein-disulfide isomerase
MSQEKEKSFFEKASPFFVILSIVLAFFVGSLWQRVRNYENSGSSPSNKGNSAQEKTLESPISVANLKKMAKNLNLDTKKFDSCLDNGEKAEVVKKDFDYGSSLGVSGTPAFFINGRFLGGAFPYESFKEIIDKELEGKGSSNYKNYSEDLQDAYNKGYFNPEPKNIDISGSNVLGREDAKVTLVEFTDFECPFCIRHFTQTWPNLKKNYIDTGKVKFVSKNYPLSSLHPNAQKAAEAAECASDQGKYWEMHDMIFSAK